MENLTQQKCVPCEGGIKPLTPEQYQPFLSQVPDWSVIEEKKIERDFTFANFKAALEFINKVGAIAEQEGHHPDILLYDYKNVRITLFTHKINGLFKNDFILAAKIDGLID
jgi:4a-hydroxytetrahydrobiopterin dehydratase